MKPQNKDKSYAHDLLVKQIVLAVSATKLARVWEQPTGAAYRSGKLIHYGLVGCADISGVLIGGRRIEIEVKTGAAVQSPGQIAFQKMILEFGAIYILARDIESTIQSIRLAAEKSQLGI